jgi:hypothetical protein
LSIGIEFGSRPAANRIRDRFEEHICPIDDDRREKTVFFVGDAPESVIEQAEAEAAEDRAAADARSNTESLTEAERDRIKDADGFDMSTTTANWRSAKGVFAREGLTDQFRDAIGNLSDYDDPIEGAEEYTERYQRTGQGGGGRDAGEEDQRRRRKEERAAQRVQKEGCNHAEGGCKNGDPEACEFLQEVCGFSEEEVADILPSISTDGGLKSGMPDADELTGQQAGAVNRAMGGYSGAVTSIETAIQTLREEWNHAQQAARAVNSVRESVGYEAQHFDRLEELQAEVLDFTRTMAADCSECHADHSDHQHDVTDGDREDVREAVVEGADATPVGTSDETDAADEVIETDDQRDLSGERADDQARFAGGERGETETETATEPERNPGGLEADERDETNSETETRQARPDAFQVAEGGQETLQSQQMPPDLPAHIEDAVDDDPIDRPKTPPDEGQTVEKKAGQFVRYNGWPLHINPKAHKLWAAEVTGYDPSTKYNWIQDFLDSTYLNDDLHYDVSGVSAGDYLRVKAASHSNDKTRVLRVLYTDDDLLKVEKLRDDEAIEALS